MLSYNEDNKRRPACEWVCATPVSSLRVVAFVHKATLVVLRCHGAHNGLPQSVMQLLGTLLHRSWRRPKSLQGLRLWAPPPRC